MWFVLKQYYLDWNRIRLNILFIPLTTLIYLIIIVQYFTELTSSCKPVKLDVAEGCGNLGGVDIPQSKLTIIPFTRLISFTEGFGMGINLYFLTLYLLGYERWGISDFSSHQNGVEVYSYLGPNVNYLVW